MLGSLLLTFIIFWSSSTFSAAPIVAAFEQDKDITLLKFTRADKRIANNIKKIYKLSKRNLLNKTLIYYLHKDIIKNKNFSYLSEWSKSLRKISRTNNLHRINKICIKIKKQDSKDLLLQHLFDTALENCKLKYFDLLSAQVNKNKLKKKELSFIFEDFSQSEIQKFETKFIELLENSTRLKYNYKLLSDSIISKIQDQSLAPSKELIKAINVTPSFTRYLQTQDLESNLTQKIFYGEFKKLKDITFNLLNKNAPREEIISANKNFYDYYKNVANYLPKKKAIATILSLSKSFSRRSYFEQAQIGFRLVIEKDSYNFEDAVFNLMWTHYSQKDYDLALETIDQNIKSHSTLASNSKLHFWKGSLLELTGDENAAKDVYKKIINENPLSFYAILSAKALGNDQEEETKLIYLTNLPQDNREKVKQTTQNKKWIKRVTLWAQNNMSEFVDLEIKSLTLKNQGKSINDQIKFLAYQLKRNKNYLESFKIIYKSVNNKLVTLDARMLKILFPKPFFNQIEKQTKDFDPIIALSLIRQESGFNKFARSHVGARGLMQLMPNTAKQFKRKLKSRQLYNPSLNIKIGTEYFNTLLESYNNNLVYSLAAYNAGESRVNLWQQEYMTSDNILTNIENIPFLETRKYVKLIFRNIFFYKMILNKDLKDFSKKNQIYDIKLGFNG